MARNPAARSFIQLALILGLAFIESLVLFTLVIIFVKVAWEFRNRNSFRKESLCQSGGLFVA